jgi:alkanesulfonate monooxygenase SsuD/methylene tetrahydromethanopterin reductase-like flavin-dependent oxidoreductase (luciferase family)
MKFGLHLPNFGALADPLTVAGLAARAEAAGWDGFFLWDHVARNEGVFPMCDPWITLAAVAVGTQRMRIGPLITPLSRRRPWIVARQVATLDHLSGGRVTFGIGLGVSGVEFGHFGEETDPRVRGDMLDEGLDILRKAWDGAPVSHTGAHYQLDSVELLPPPVQSPVPIWGATERTTGRPVRRAARLDGVFPNGLRPDQLPDLLANVSRLRPEGLDGYDVVVGGVDDWREWRDAGATWWLRVLPRFGSIEESADIVDSGPPAG